MKRLVGLINAQSEKIELLTEELNVGDDYGSLTDNISVVPVKLIEIRGLNLILVRGPSTINVRFGSQNWWIS